MSLAFRPVVLPGKEFEHFYSTDGLLGPPSVQQGVAESPYTEISDFEEAPEITILHALPYHSDLVCESESSPDCHEDKAMERQTRP